MGIYLRVNVPQQYTNISQSIHDAIVYEMQQSDLDNAIANLFGEDFYIALYGDIGNPPIPLYDDGWMYDGIYNQPMRGWDGLQIVDGGDMIDVYIEPGTPGASDAICIVYDNADWSDVQFLIGTTNSEGFDFQLSSLASHFYGKETICIFIFKY